ncbi:uncharacterized protein LOC107841293 [Capsicum annuum]|uniref:uncharacterized protein LOC107841293 n=1 Tax=Capsicum annuum TaxID=4072 RepID=UPI0007BEEB5C|nr:uncharacterized protein LOC107841293 [Capsicum annuum]
MASEGDQCQKEVAAQAYGGPSPHDKKESTQDLQVDPIDDEIDSSCEINLCPPNVEAYMLNGSTSSFVMGIDQLRKFLFYCITFFPSTIFDKATQKLRNHILSLNDLLQNPFCTALNRFPFSPKPFHRNPLITNTPVRAAPTTTSENHFEAAPTTTAPVVLRLIFRSCCRKVGPNSTPPLTSISALKFALQCLSNFRIFFFNLVILRLGFSTLKSNQHRVVKTPGGKLICETIIKTASGPKCPVTGKRIHRIPHLRPSEYKRFISPRNCRTVNRAYRGVLSGSGVRKRYAFFVSKLHIGF